MRTRLLRAFSAVAATVVTVASATLAGGPQPASAALTSPLTCTAAANLETINDVGIHYVWTLSGGGQCADPSTTYTAEIAGAGSSVGLGLCDASEVVQNLKLDMTLTLTSTTTGLVTATTEQFESPLTTYPIATPFLVAKGNNTIGAGNLDTHIFLHCPPGGTPSTFLVWTQQ